MRFLSKTVHRIWEYIVQKQSSWTTRLFIYCGAIYLSSFFVGIIVLLLGEEALTRGRDTGGVFYVILITLCVDIVVLTLFYKEIRRIFYRLLAAILLCLLAIPLGIVIYFGIIPALHLQAFHSIIYQIDFMSRFTGIGIEISFALNLIIMFEVVVLSYVNPLLTKVDPKSWTEKEQS